MFTLLRETCEADDVLLVLSGGIRCHLPVFPNQPRSTAGDQLWDRYVLCITDHKRARDWPHCWTHLVSIPPVTLQTEAAFVANSLHRWKARSLSRTLGRAYHTDTYKTLLLLLIESGLVIAVAKLFEFTLFEVANGEFNALYIVFDMIPQINVSARPYSNSGL